MAADRGISTGPNSRPLDDTVAETGPGISDDAVMDGELGPEDLGPGAEAMIEGLRRKGWTGQGASDAPSEAAAEAETEAHPT